MIALALTLIWWFGRRKTTIIHYYNGTTPLEFDIYLAEKEAKEAREQLALYPELRYEVLRAQYEYGEISKVAYEQALDSLIKDIEI